MGSDGDMDVDGGGDGDGDGNLNGHWALDWDADKGEYEEDGVEQEPELEHDVSRSIH